MAVTVTTRFDGVNVKEFDVTADADADTDATIAHNFNAVPFVTITPLGVSARISQWVATVITATNLQIDKTILVGSGDAAAQVRVTMVVPEAQVMG